VPQPVKVDALIIALVSFVLLVWLDIHPVLLILAATLFGALVYAR